MILSILERSKINNELPIFTLDVNQVALRNPSSWPPAMHGLAHLEWNYFMRQNIELCVTPETEFEITQGIEVNSLGARAYERFQKTQLFKNRPPGTTLSLAEPEANELWMGIRTILWPSAADNQLSAQQRADVNQLFFHTIASSTMANAAFLTVDGNFLSHATEMKDQVGVTIRAPRESWQEYAPRYSLYVPSDEEIQYLWQQQQSLLSRLRSEANA